MEGSSVASDPRYRQGGQFLREKKFEEAIALFASLTETCVQNYGEMALESARAYYAYGNALLTQEEENPRSALFGNVEEPADEGADRQNEQERVEDVDDEDDENDNDEAADEGKDASGAGEEQDGEEAEAGSADDLQVAWEVLDVARAILEKERGKDDLLLADVYVRLGDLLRLNDCTVEAIAEYSKALEIRQRLCPPHDRQLSSVHFSLAVAHEYNAPNGDPLASKSKALEHYLKAKESLTVYQQQQEQQSAGDKEEVEGILIELAETISALQQDIEEQRKAPVGSSSSSSAPVTTIGFDLPSVQDATATLATIGTKRSAESEAPVMSTLTVKKKVKPDP